MFRTSHIAWPHGKLRTTRIRACPLSHLELFFTRDIRVPLSFSLSFTSAYEMFTPATPNYIAGTTPFSRGVIQFSTQFPRRGAETRTRGERGEAVSPYLSFFCHVFPSSYVYQKNPSAFFPLPFFDTCSVSFFSKIGQTIAIFDQRAVMIVS